MVHDLPLQFLERPGGARLAFRKRDGAGGVPQLLWLGGFMSDMKGTKATALDHLAAAKGWPFLRFDYFAHGESSGSLAEARIGRWRADALAVIDSLSQEPLILIGSSMGGWMALLAALARPKRIAGLVLIAPAADFTQTLMWPKLSETAQTQLRQGGTYALPSSYELAPFPLTLSFFDEAREHLILNRPLPVEGPVRILQGMQDPDVPWGHALKVAQAISSADLTVTLIKQGDHRLSSPADIARLSDTVSEIMSLTMRKAAP